MAKGFGDHYLVDFYGCDANVIATAEPTMRALLTAAQDCGATILEHNFHEFSPHGVSGVILIAESHISIHTWPENHFAAVDIFTCGEDMKPDIAIRILEEALGASRADVVKLTRGSLEPS